MAGMFCPAGEHGGETGGQCFAFARRHFRQITAMQRQRAHELDGKWSQAKFAIGCFPDRRERGQNVLFRVFAATPKMFPKFTQPQLQLSVRQFAPFAFLGDDFIGVRTQCFQHFPAPLIFADEAIDERIKSGERSRGHAIAAATIILRGNGQHRQSDLITLWSSCHKLRVQRGNNGSAPSLKLILPERPSSKPTLLVATKVPRTAKNGSADLLPCEFSSVATGISPPAAQPNAADGNVCCPPGISNVCCPPGITRQSETGSFVAASP